MGKYVGVVSQCDIWGVDLLILVALGTQDKTFERLIQAVEKQIQLGNIKEEVIVQAGQTKYESKVMEIFDFIDMEKFDALLDKCNILITHGGVGTIISALHKKKKIIAAPRLEKFGEHTNDHQLQIIQSFTASGYILPLYDFNKLDEVLKQTEDFEIKSYKSNTKNMMDLVREKIDS